MEVATGVGVTAGLDDRGPPQTAVELVDAAGRVRHLDRVDVRRGAVRRTVALGVQAADALVERDELLRLMTPSLSVPSPYCTPTVSGMIGRPKPVVSSTPYTLEMKSAMAQRMPLGLSTGW